MIRTKVCEREGCRGNSFNICTEEDKLLLTCVECGEKYMEDAAIYDYVMLSNCCNCNNDSFKIFKETQKPGLYAKCTSCGNPPDKLYIDESGTQLSYEQKKLGELKDLISRLGERLDNIEDKADLLAAEQQVIQQSLGYIAEFVQKNP